MIGFMIGILGLVGLLCLVTSKARHILIILLFIGVAGLVAYVSPNFYEGLILVLGLFIPFFVHFLDESISKQNKSKMKPSGYYQTIVIVTSTLLLSVLLLQIYKRRDYIDSLWNLGDFKNRTVYHFMSEYYDLSLYLATMIVAMVVLVGKRLSEARKS